MLTQEQLRKFHSTECIIAFVLNLVLISLIIRKTSTVIGKYSYLLLGFSVFNLLYVTVDFLIVPTTIVSGRTYVLAVTSPIFASKLLNYILLLVYCCLFCQILILLMFQFVFRYTVANEQSFFKKLSKKEILFVCFFVYAVFSGVWTINSHLTLGAVQPDVYLDMSRVYFENFGRPLNETSCIGQSFSSATNSSLWIAYFGTLMLIVILSITWSVIIYSGYQVFKLLGIKEAVSQKTRALQKELFKALVVQLLVPLFCNYLPLTCINGSAVFGIPMNIEPMCILVMETIIRFICCRKAPDTKVYTSSGGNAFTRRRTSSNKVSEGNQGTTTRTSVADAQIEISISKI
ncbi:unnamed protein product, partial [Mesorhabditis spiculigera]